MFLVFSPVRIKSMVLPHFKCFERLQPSHLKNGVMEVVKVQEKVT